MKKTVVGSSLPRFFLLQSQNLHTVYVIITVYAGRKGMENGRDVPMVCGDDGDRVKIGEAKH